MVVDDIQFLNLLKGKRVKLTLKTSSYLGVVQRINPNKTLVLADVSGSNGCKILGSKMFFGHEILNVEFTKEAKSDHGNNQDQRLEEHLTVEKFQPYRKKMMYDDEDDEEYINTEVIDEFHEKFGPAISTKNKVYLFDILVLGARAFKNGLSMILENNHILKVIHDCRTLAGCLFAQFGVKLTNVFDTQVADVMCFYSETGGFLPARVSTLDEVVSLHLKVPSSQLQSLQMKSQLTQEEREMWQKRPCPVPLLKVMALSVVHLQPLRLVLLDTLMTDYVTLVDSYLNSSHFQPDELEHVTMESVLELPKELKQLEQMRCEKQERAAEHYPITEKGLLDRFNPRSQTKSSPSEQHDLIEPNTVQTPFSLPGDPIVPKLPMSTLQDTNVAVAVASDPATQVPSTAASADQVTANIPPSVGRGRGHIGALLEAMGPGRPLGKGSQVAGLPALGRGFLLQMSQGQTLPQEVMPHNCSDSLKDTSGLRTPQPSSSPPCKSFRPFSF